MVRHSKERLHLGPDILGTFILRVPIDASVRLLVCPQCRGTDLYYEAGLITGYKYHCKSCSYVGAFVIEVEMDLPEGGK